jgi:exosortase/archaeosortase family protein
MLKSQAQFFSRSRPTVYFVMKVAIFMGVFLSVYRDDFIGRLLGPWVELTARTTVALLDLLDVEAIRIGGQIHHPGGFAYEIYYRCTAVLPAALLTALILASTACLRDKLLGMALGVSVLIAVNLMRLVHLFHLGVHRSILFEAAHGMVWELILITVTLGLWWLWSRWAIRSHPPR